jgi:hypothetical protein
VIESVAPDPAFEKQAITIRGRNLYSEAGTFVRLPTGDVAVTPPAATDREIQVTLPSGLRPGPNVVQVVHQVQLGPPGQETPHRGFESDPAVFALAPLILTGPPPPGTPALPATIARGSLLTIGVSPQVGARQRTVLMLGSLALSRYKPPPPASGPLPAPEPELLPSVTFRIPPSPASEFPPQPADAIPIGDYVLRLSVDDVQSPLERPDLSGWTPPKIGVT